MYKKEYKEIVEVAILAGMIMLQANAECYRVENTVGHILSTSHLPTIDVFANTTGLFITLDGPDLAEPITYVKRISKRDTNLMKIHLVNQISRDITSNTITIKDANKALLNIQKNNYTKKKSDIAIIFLVISFVVLFGGDIKTILLAVIAAVVLVITDHLKSYLNLNDFISGTFSTTVVATIIPILTKISGGSDHSLNIVIISALMPVFPGTAFTNGFRDSFKGDYGAGVTKIVEALIIAASLGAGVAIGLFIARGIMS